MFFRHAAYTGEEPNRYIDFPRHFCHSRLTDRTGETCEASGPEGSCGSLSLFIPKKEMIRIAKPYKSYDDLLAFLQNDKNLIIENIDAAKHHKVPLWIMVQVLTIGQISHMFDYLNASVPIKVCNDFHQVTRKDMHSFLSVMTKHRNVCAHSERFFNYVTKDSITDTPLHTKLHIPKMNWRFQNGNYRTIISGSNSSCCCPAVHLSVL